MYSDDSPFGMSLGDLMAALLLIFILLLSATLMLLQQEAKKLEQQQKDKIEEARIAEEKFREAEKTAREVERIADAYERLKVQLYNDLMNEFKDDLAKWNATIDRETITVRFREPEVLFGRGETDIKETFMDILVDFFPRYINLLAGGYRNDIEEIRIEGHTSSEWATEVSEEAAYILNMKLSQDRTRSVLQFILDLVEPGLKHWARERITANGLSSSKLILTVTGEENREASRRVDFRVRTNAEEVIGEILAKSRLLERGGALNGFHE